MNNNECALPRGKMLGGTSSINYMIYNRGNRRDYDSWAAAGSKGWSYDEVLPYFLKSENAHLAGLEWSLYHNHSGPLNVEDIGFRTQFAHAFVRGAQQAGHPHTDYNGESQVGVSSMSYHCIPRKIRIGAVYGPSLGCTSSVMIKTSTLL
ncbi:oxygen-dependent choline dehydrogenase-like [Zeugodacus cucurbitae]|uniref:oxygen-dependent choline dehydrogenase-like n=1 Tax=Zeugodacus cucurbitae TaxID=28588 RepID=UPI0023D951FB|nr:oxygen-dependent choline dehydrogenase-like [Zeugodacus cucurbitae]